MNRPRRGLLALIVAGLALSGCTSGNDATVYGGSFTFTSPGGRTEFSYPAGARQQLGAMSGPDLAGSKTIDVAGYRGRVVVLNFWGSWCSPCREEAPGLELAWQELRGKGVQFLGVDVKDPASAAQGFTAGKQITYPSIFDPAMRTLLSVRGLPSGSLPVTMVLDKKGKVAHIWLHPIDQGDLNRVLGPLTAEV